MNRKLPLKYIVLKRIIIFLEKECFYPKVGPAKAEPTGPVPPGLIKKTVSKNRLPNQHESKKNLRTLQPENGIRFKNSQFQTNCPVSYEKECVSLTSRYPTAHFHS